MTDLINNCMEIDMMDNNMECLENFINLTSLDIQNSDVYDKHLQHIILLTNLEHLTLKNDYYIEEGIECLSNMTKLKSLNLNIKLSNFQFLNKMTRLKRLCLNNKLITDILIMDLHSIMPELEYLSLPSCKLSNVGINNLIQLTNLEHLNLSNTKIRDDNLQIITNYLINLKSLELESCDELTNHGLIYLSRLINLEHINLNYNKNITYKGLNILKDLKKINSLFLKHYYTNDNEDFELIFPQDIKKLSVSRCIMSNESLQSLSKSNELIFFDVSHIENINKVLPCLINMTKLQELHLSNNIILQNSLQLNNLINLQILNMSYCEMNQRLSKLYVLPKLIELDFACTTIIDQDMQYVGKIIKLQKLELHKCRMITDNGIKYLSKLTNLEYLNLQGCSITGKGFKHLSNLTRLKTLDLKGTQMSDCNIKYLPKNLNILRIEETNITNICLQYLNIFTKLKELCVANTNITEEAFYHSINNIENFQHYCC